MDRVISVAGIEYEFRRRGQVMFIDTDGALRVWGLRSKRAGCRELLAGHEAEMKRFLTARALRGAV